VNLVILGLIFLLGLALQSTLFVFCQIGGVRPDILMVLVILLGLLRGPLDGGKLGFLAGLLEDLVVGEFIGINAFVKMCVGALVGLFERRFYKENLLIPLLAVLGGTFFGSSLFIFLSNSFGHNVPWYSSIHLKVAPMCLYNSIVSLVLYKPVNRLNRYLDTKKRPLRR
jgi:rod shape-determining protein MreD